jgi:hypothetical protein
MHGIKKQCVQIGSTAHWHPRLMANTGALAAVHNLVLDAKRFSARTQIVQLGDIAEQFSARYASMDESERAALRTEFPGISQKRYENGWIGAWNRMVACDPDMVGDLSISARTMVRYLKFLPVARTLVQRVRMDAIPLKLSGACEALQRALAVVHSADVDAHERSKAVDAIADGFIAAYEVLGKSLTSSSAHGAVIGESIMSACLDHGVDIGEAPAPKPVRAKKRVRNKDDADQQKQTVDQEEPVGKDWSSGPERGKASNQGEGGEEDNDSEVEVRDVTGAHKGVHKGGRASAASGTLEDKVAKLTRNDHVAKEIVRRLEKLVPDVHREVMFDMCSGNAAGDAVDNEKGNAAGSDDNEDVNAAGSVEDDAAGSSEAECMDT